jgi:hypothetical protein
MEPGLAITAGSLATLRKLPALVRARLGWTPNETPANGSSGDDSFMAVGSPRKAHVNDLSTTASDFSTRGARYVGPPGREVGSDGLPAYRDTKSEMTAQTRWFEDVDPPLEGARAGRRTAETRTARGLTYESRFKYEPAYRTNEVPEETIDEVDVEMCQPAAAVSRYCEAGESWSPKGRRKNGRRDRDPT